MSACATCRRPGACCTGLALNPTPDHPTTLHALVWLATTRHRGEEGEHRQLGFPFLPLYRSEARNGWVYWCPVLDRSGRCGDYENRPALCRAYEPMSDALCAEWPGHAS